RPTPQVKQAQQLQQAVLRQPAGAQKVQRHEWPQINCCRFAAYGKEKRTLWCRVRGRPTYHCTRMTSRPHMRTGSQSQTGAVSGWAIVTRTAAFRLLTQP